MNYEEQSIMGAFRIYTLLARNGQVEKMDWQQYIADDAIRSLVDQFAQQVECQTITVGNQLYMIPKSMLSPFHVNNDYLKKTYLKSGATNADLYMMYFATIVLIGEFYDSYQMQSTTRDFMPLEEWVVAVNKRVNIVKEHSIEQLQTYSKEYSYNWTAIVEKWETMDELKETAKKQTGNTISRLSFLDTVKRFLLDQGIVIDLGNAEITLTDKAKTIVQRYFMELEYNRNILEFLYAFENERQGDESNA